MNRIATSLVLLLALITLVIPQAHEPALSATDREAPVASSPRRANVPYTNLSENIPAAARAIFWFGQVTPTMNYADVRTIYNDDALYVTLHITDRRLWYDLSPAADELTEWDAATLYLDLSGGISSVPTRQSHRFVAQLNHWQPRPDWQTAYQGDGTGWSPAPTAFTAETFWRGFAPNSLEDDRAWSVTYRVPFSSLGLAGAPTAATTWGLALAVYDRDDQAGTPIPVQRWPETADYDAPATWGKLRFGVPSYVPRPTSSSQKAMIRHGLDGAVVADAPVGGHTICGQPFWPDFFDGWGDAVHQDVYSPPDQFNIQNLWDVGDWPCFSKFYVTFPLDRVPAGQTIISATLTLHHWGNADPSLAQPSEIQALAVAEPWAEDTLTWNNAPLAVENISRTTVYPVSSAADWPGIPYHWDVSRAAAHAYAAGEPLRLVLYSADGPYHSGKYFSSSEAGDWNEVARPALVVSWGEPVSLEPALFFPVVLAP